MATYTTVVEREELFDPDNIQIILRDDMFSRDIRKKLTFYNRERTHGGRVKVQYHFGKGCEEGKIGRLYVKNYEGIQAFPYDIRNPLTQKYYWDIDMVNCHYHLMRQFCKANGLPHEKIAEYCDNREALLAQVSSNRSLAKIAFLKVAYGGNIRLSDIMNDSITDDGEQAEGNLEILRQIEAEIRGVIVHVKNAFPNIVAVAEQICKKKKVWADKNGRYIVWNSDYTALALTLQTEERKCLLAISDYLTSIGRQMDVLIHDGGLVRKLEGEAVFPEAIMRGAERYVYEKLGYEIHLVNKPIKHDLKIPEEKVLPIGTIVDDNYAARVFVEVMGNNIIRSDDIYFYIEDKGVWEAGDQAFRTVVSLNANKLIFNVASSDGIIKQFNYGGCEKNVSAMRKWIAAHLPVSAPIDAVKSKEAFLFANGWFDMSNMTFYEGFDGCRDKFFMRRIPRDFMPMRNRELEEEIHKAFFINPYNNPAVGALYRNSIARALSGKPSKEWNVVIGPPNCGKTAITTALQCGFGDYIGTFNMNVLKYNPRDGADEAKKLAWYAPLIGCRIAIGNEARIDGRPLDGNLMKSFSSGGDNIMLRRNFENQFTVIPNTTFFTLLNDLPPITPCDEALKSRMTSIPHTKTFVNKPQAECNEYEMEADPLLKDKMKDDEWVHSFFWVIMEGYNAGVALPRPREVIEDIDELFVVEDIKIKQILEEHYEFVPTDGEDYVPARDIIKFLTDNGVRMTDTKIGRELKKMGLKKADKKVGGKKMVVYYGLKA